MRKLLDSREAGIQIDRKSFTLRLFRSVLMFIVFFLSSYLFLFPVFSAVFSAHSLIILGCFLVVIMAPDCTGQA